MSLLIQAEHDAWWDKATIFVSLLSFAFLPSLHVFSCWMNESFAVFLLKVSIQNGASLHFPSVQMHLKNKTFSTTIYKYECSRATSKHAESYYVRTESANRITCSSLELHVSFNRPIKRARAAARSCSPTFWSAEGKASRPRLGGSARSSPNASSSSWTAATLSRLWTPPTDCCCFFSALLPTRVQSAAMNLEFSSHNNVFFFSCDMQCVWCQCENTFFKNTFTLQYIFKYCFKFFIFFCSLRFPVTLHYTWLTTECSSVQLVFLNLHPLRDLKGFLYVLISLGILPGLTSLAEMMVTSAELKNGAEAEMPLTAICRAPTWMWSFINYEINTFSYNKKWDLNCWLHLHGLRCPGYEPYSALDHIWDTMFTQRLRNHFFYISLSILFSWVLFGISTLSIRICLSGFHTLTRKTTYSHHDTIKLSSKKLNPNKIKSIQQDKMNTTRIK